jgi:prepilin-type N-terminal cleavage/methylation domain-containing protein
MMSHAQRKTAAQRGLTLVEMLTVLAVLAVAMSLSMGSWSSTLDRLRLHSQSQELAAHVHMARSTAVATGRAVLLEVQSNARGSCLLIHQGGAGACHCNDAGRPVCDATRRVVSTQWWPSGSRVQLSANSASMRFEPTAGTVTPTGALKLSLPDGRALALVVNVMGRSRACSLGGLTAGAPACQ